MAANDYYTSSGVPVLGNPGSSSDIRAELLAIVAAFNLLPALSGNGRKRVEINSAGNALVGVDKVTPSTLTVPLTRNDSIGFRVKLAAGVTIPVSTFSADDEFLLYNNTAAGVTLTQDTGLTLRLGGTTTTGNRTLAARGECKVVFLTPTEAVVFGNVT